MGTLSVLRCRDGDDVAEPLADDDDEEEVAADAAAAVLGGVLMPVFSGMSVEDSPVRMSASRTVQKLLPIMSRRYIPLPESPVS